MSLFDFSSMLRSTGEDKTGFRKIYLNGNKFDAKKLFDSFIGFNRFY
jgi:hypothetical protein